MTDEPNPDLLRGTLDMLALKIVALGPNHGPAAAERLRRISKEFFTVHQGSLYPALQRLEDRGWLSAEWRDTDTGREAKSYDLTSKGRKQLKTKILDWEQLSNAVALILRAAE